MDEVMKAILERRSCRSFKPDLVPEDILNQIIEAGLYAPHGGGRQDTLTLVITNPELRNKLSKMNKLYGVRNTSDEYDPFYGGPVVMVVFGKKGSNTMVHDPSLQIGTMLLAAHSLGLAGIWIHRAKEEFESEEGKAILRELGIPDEYEGVGHCVIGYPAEEPKPAAPRKEGRVVFAR